MAYLQAVEDVASGRATLVVLLPDARQSQLVGTLERWITEQTSCVPIARQEFRFTRDALERFYPALRTALPLNVQLVFDVFSASHSLATLWFGEGGFGEGASHLLRKLKGETHPARCPSSTLRGRFWCDNAVANLVHVSDDGAEVAREIDVLRSLVPDLFRDRIATQPLPAFVDSGPPVPRHSGILTLCSLVTTLLSDQKVRFDRLELPGCGGARQTMRVAEAWLRGLPTGGSIAAAITSYLDGTAEPAQWLAALRSAVHVGAWEELILRCGLLSRPEWLERR